MDGLNIPAIRYPINAPQIVLTQGFEVMGHDPLLQPIKA